MRPMNVLWVGIVTLIAAYLTLALFSPRNVVFQKSIEIERSVDFCFQQSLRWSVMAGWNPLFPENLFQMDGADFDTSKAGILKWKIPKAEVSGIVKTDSVFPAREIRFYFTYLNGVNATHYRTAMLFESISNTTRITWQMQGEDRTFLLHPLNLFYAEAMKKQFSYSLDKLKTALEK